MSPHERTRAVYVISVAAELAGVHPQTLRIYERKGLVEPARTQGGSRRYSDEDISLLVLAAGTGRDGPGPLVSALAGKGAGTFPIPVAIVPGHLADEEIDALA